MPFKVHVDVTINFMVQRDKLEYKYHFYKRYSKYSLRMPFKVNIWNDHNFLDVHLTSLYDVSGFENSSHNLYFQWIYDHHFAT